MTETIRTVILAMSGAAAGVFATCILKLLFDLIVKLLARGNKKFGLFVMKKRRERFNLQAADLINNVNECRIEVSKINISMRKLLRQELDSQFHIALESKDTKDNLKFLDILDNYLEVGGQYDEKIKGQQRMLALAARGLIDGKDDGSLDF